MSPRERLAAHEERIKALERTQEKSWKIWIALALMVASTIWHAAKGALH